MYVYICTYAYMYARLDEPEIGSLDILFFPSVVPKFVYKINTITDA